MYICENKNIMAFTQEQLDTLEAAIAQGVKRVEYADKVVEYPSLKDMLALLDTIRQVLVLISGFSGNRKLASYNKGVYPNDNCY